MTTNQLQPFDYGYQRPARSTFNYATLAVGEFVIRPNAAQHAARMFVRMGLRDPRAAMERATALGAAASWYFWLMSGTGMIAICAVAIGGAGMEGVLNGSPDYRHDSALVYFAVMAVGLLWLWGLKVINGAMLQFFVRDLPVRFWRYRWYWPRTTRSGLRVTALPFVIFNRSRTVWDRFIAVFSILMWAVFIKLPLYYCVGIAVVSMFKIVVS